MTPATMNLRVTEIPEVRRVLEEYGRRLDLLLAEHAALHAYLAAGLLHNRTHQHYCDLIDAHDAVALLLSATEAEDEPCNVEPALSQHEYAVDYCETHDQPADQCVAG